MEKEPKHHEDEIVPDEGVPVEYGDVRPSSDLGSIYRRSDAKTNDNNKGGEVRILSWKKEDDEQTDKELKLRVWEAGQRYLGGARRRALILKNLRFLSGKKKAAAIESYNAATGEIGAAIQDIVDTVLLKDTAEHPMPHFLAGDAQLIRERKEDEKTREALEREHDLKEWLGNREIGIPAVLLQQIVNEILNRTEVVEPEYHNEMISLQNTSSFDDQAFGEGNETAGASRYIPFDPAEEMEKIPKFSQKELDDLSPYERVVEKRARLKRFKEQQIDQQLQIAELNAEIEDNVLAGIADQEPLMNYIMSQAPRLRLSRPQIEKYRKAIEGVSKQHDRIETVFAKYFKDKSEKEIFEKIFGFSPRGGVTIEKGAAYVYVTITDEQDFAAAYRGDFTGSVTEEDIKKVERVGGFASAKTIQPNLGSCVAVSRAYIYPSTAERVKKHELRHALHSNIWGMERWGRIEPDKDRSKKTKEEESRDSFSRSLDLDAETYLFCAKDEILAYLKDGRDMDEARKTLLRDKEDGGLYDYFESRRPSYERSVYAQDHPDEYRNLFREKRKEHEAVISKCIGVLKDMEILGFSRDEIAGIFEVEHPLRWERILENLRLSSRFMERKNNAYTKLSHAFNDAKDKILYYRGVVREIRSKSSRTDEDNTKHDFSFAMMQRFEKEALRLQDDLNRLEAISMGRSISKKKVDNAPLSESF